MASKSEEQRSVEEIWKERFEYQSFFTKPHCTLSQYLSCLTGQEDKAARSEEPGAGTCSPRMLSVSSGDVFFQCKAGGGQEPGSG